MAGLLSYLKVPAYAVSGFATLASGALYWKQKHVSPPIPSHPIPLQPCLLDLLTPTTCTCSELIYPRYIPPGSRTEEGLPRPDQFGVTDWEDCKIITPDGETLNAFLIRPSNPLLTRPVTVLMFHGNAGNIGHRVPIAKKLMEDNGCNILMLECRGYGLSTGEPDEAGFIIDAQTGLDYLRQHTTTKGNDVVVYGQSIGGALAVQLVAKNLGAKDIKGLILENTFVSMRKLIPRYCLLTIAKMEADGQAV